MITYEETEELRRLARELNDLLSEGSVPQGLTELGYDQDAESFRGRRVA
ncbi:hypothetical protein GCM10010211_49090 [Streptomyces albospinus]|uniref:Uncharacterized protein n=1 Tax=Streptomyces albospinus TaxID=285515 RepID=A0ABQ2VDC3_9ACTN|nr:MULTISPECIES: hypothetical protein [Streptomyces]GGU77354.1 hypothetical protein GCM10010211_49090 [Streptomyces albospinus]